MNNGGIEKFQSRFWVRFEKKEKNKNNTYILIQLGENFFLFFFFNRSFENRIVKYYVFCF